MEKVVPKVEAAVGKYAVAARVRCRSGKIFKNVCCRIMRLVEIIVFVLVKGEVIQQELQRPTRSGICGV